MKRLSPVLMSLLLLCSCSGNSSGGGAEAVRDYYKTLESAAYTVTQRTDFGDRVMDFKLSYTHSAAQGDTFEILEPEAIKGIKASLKGEGAQIAFEDMILELGKLPGTGLSPLEALPFMLVQWKDGHVTSEGKETADGKSCVRLSYKTTQGGVAVEHHAWFDAKTYAPMRAELLFDGAQVVSCTFE